MRLAISGAITATDILGRLAPDGGCAVCAADEVFLVVAAAEERIAGETNGEDEEGGGGTKVNRVAA